MRIHDPVLENLVHVLSSIEDAVTQRRLLPCLILLYSTIDVMANLERKGGETGKTAFTRWVEQYLLVNRKLPCTALELYGARCGILHSFSADSDISRAGKARRVVYVFESVNADLSEPFTAMRRLSHHPYVLVSVRELVNSFHSGLIEYLEELKGERQRQRRVGTKFGLWFTRVDCGLR